MNKVTRLKYYIESLCIYDFEDDDVFSALYDLLCDDEEDCHKLIFEKAYLKIDFN